MADDGILKLLDCAVKHDTWGQRVEAAEKYEAFVVAAQKKKKSIIATAQNEYEKIIKNASDRAQFLQPTSPDGGPPGEVEESFVDLSTVKKDVDMIRNILAKNDRKLSKRKSSMAMIEESGLLPPVRDMEEGKMYFTIHIEKIGMKDAEEYVDPFMSISVRDSKGELLEDEQNTSPSYFITGDQYIVFNVHCYIQTPLDDFPNDFAFFFEFNHYKEKKDKVSTKCYAFIEADEVKDGAACIELYQKPVDYTRKKLALLTEKPLFLHLKYSIKTG